MTVQAAPLPLTDAQRVKTSSISEATLIAGYRVPGPVDRWVECACGEWLSAEHGSETSMLAAVVTHNESTAHARWRRRREAAG